jgi:protein gp37
MENTLIEWAEHTFNPWEGCTKVSNECDNCYAERRDYRFHAGSHWGKNALRLFHADAYWKKPLKWDRDAQAAGERHQVFCGSLCDVMESRPDLPQLHEVRSRLYRPIEQTPNLDWLLLTKRPQNFRPFLPKSWLNNPQPNVWGMTTAGKNSSLWRVDALLDVPFVIHGVSMEPLLEPMDIPAGVDWIIVGGESESGARVCDIEWIRFLIGQARASRVACFVKQLGSKPCDGVVPLKLKDNKGEDPSEWPVDLRLREWPTPIAMAVK